MFAVMGHIPPQALFVLLKAATKHMSRLTETKGSKMNKEHGVNFLLKDWRAPFPNSKKCSGESHDVGPEENHGEKRKGVVENS